MTMKDLSRQLGTERSLTDGASRGDPTDEGSAGVTREKDITDCEKSFCSIRCASEPELWDYQEASHSPQFYLPQDSTFYTADNFGEDIANWTDDVGFGETASEPREFQPSDKNDPSQGSLFYTEPAQRYDVFQASQSPQSAGERAFEPLPPLLESLAACPEGEVDALHAYLPVLRPAASILSPYHFKTPNKSVLDDMHFFVLDHVTTESQKFQCVVDWRSILDRRPLAEENPRTQHDSHITSISRGTKIQRDEVISYAERLLLSELQASTISADWLSLESTKSESNEADDFDWKYITAILQVEVPNLWFLTHALLHKAGGLHGSRIQSKLTSLIVILLHSAGELPGKNSCQLLGRMISQVSPCMVS